MTTSQQRLFLCVLVCLCPIKAAAQSTSAADQYVVDQFAKAATVRAPLFVQEQVLREALVKPEFATAMREQLAKLRLERNLETQARALSGQLLVSSIESMESSGQTLNTPIAALIAAPGVGDEIVESALLALTQQRQAISGRVQDLRVALARKVGLTLAIGVARTREAVDLAHRLSAGGEVGTRSIEEADRFLSQVAPVTMRDEFAQRLAAASSAASKGLSETDAAARLVGLRRALLLGLQATAVRSQVQVPITELAAGLSQLHAAGDRFVEDTLEHAATAERAFRTELDAVRADWKQAVLAVTSRPRRMNMPSEIREVEAVLTRMNLLESLAKGQLPAGVSVGSVLQGVAPALGLGDREASALNSVLDIAAAKDNYAQAAVSALAVLAGKDGPLQSMSPAIDSISSVIRTAGPFIGISALASGGGALAALGGFGGGGPDLGPIQAQLAEIDSKLNVVIGKLDALAREVRANHEDVMSALETLGYDVERTRALIAGLGFSRYFAACDGIVQRSAVGANVSGDEASKSLTACIDDSGSLFTNRDLRSLLSVQLNYEKREDGPSALQHVRAVRTKLAELTKGKDGKFRLSQETCDSLMAPSWGYAAWSSDQSDHDGAVELKCDSFLTVESYLDPGMLAHLIIRERDAMRTATKSGGRGWLVPWWRQHADSVLAVRRIQLGLINEAIGQQALLAGVSSVGKLAARLDSPTESRDLGEILIGDSMLRENVVTNWTIGRVLNSGRLSSVVSGRPGPNVAYGAVYWGADRQLMSSVLGAPPHLEVVRAPDCGERSAAWQSSIRWALKFTVVARPEGKPEAGAVAAVQCVPLPTPSVLAARTLRAPKAVETLIGLRSELLRDIEGLSIDSRLASTNAARSIVLWRLRAFGAQRSARLQQ